MKEAYRSPAPVTVPYEDLRHVHQRRFANTDPDRFVRLWCEIASICEVPPSDLHEDSRVEDLCPPVRFLGIVDSSNRMESLAALTVAESLELGPPAGPLDTVGGMLDYLLGTSKPS